MSQHVVGDGDDILSLAFDAGVSVSKVFDDPANAALRDASGHRSTTILKRGDVVEVPEPEDDIVTGDAEKRHTFKLGGVPAELNLVLLKDGEPVRNTSYRITIDTVLHTGTTDGNGLLHERIFPNDKIARLRIGEDVGEFIFHLGSLDPVNTVQGLQERLYNIGFDPGIPDGDFGDGSRKAMNQFQDKNGLDKTTKPNQDTQDKLEQIHGC